MSGLGSDAAHYFSHGTGRDSYIIANNGGLYSGRYGNAQTRYEQTLRSSSTSNQRSVLPLGGSKKYRSAQMSKAQRNRARKQRTATSRLSQLTSRQQQERHINQTRRLQHDDRYAMPHHHHSTGGLHGGNSLPAIGSAQHMMQHSHSGVTSHKEARGMYMSASMPGLRAAPHSKTYHASAARSSGYGQSGSSGGSNMTAAQRTARRKAHARKLKAQIDELAHEELTRRYKSPQRNVGVAMGASGSGNYRRRKLNRNLPSLGATGGSPGKPAAVPSLKLGGIGAGAPPAGAKAKAKSNGKSSGAALRSMAQQASSSSTSYQQSSSSSYQQSSSMATSSGMHSGIQEGGEWYGIRRQRVHLGETSLARSGKLAQQESEVIVAYNAPHEGAVAGMIITTKGGRRVLAQSVDRVAEAAAGSYVPSTIKSNLPMIEAIPMPTMPGEGRSPQR